MTALTLSFISAFAFLFNIVAAYQLLKAGTFIKTRGFRLIYISISISCISSLFKLQHWPYAGQLALLFWVSTFVLAIVYSIHALKKQKKQWPDALKVVWILSYSTGLLFHQMHWLYSNELSLISLISIAIVYFHYIFFYDEIKEDAAPKLSDGPSLD